MLGAGFRFSLDTQSSLMIQENLAVQVFRDSAFQESELVVSK
jgi:hypothetical protein